MYNIVVIDDDEFFKTNFVNLINWSKFDCQIIKAFNDAESVIKYLISNSANVDIIITDICMPNMNGVELIDYVSKNFSNIRCIALSNFDDFIYVKESMQKGARDYILKNKLDDNMIGNVLRKVCDELKGNFLRSDNDNFTLIKPKIKQDFLKGLLLNQYKNEIIDKNVLDSIEINIDTNNLVLMLVKIDDYYLIEKRYDSDEGISNFINTFISMFQQIIDDWGKGIVTSLNNQYYAAVLCAGNNPSLLYVNNRINQCVIQLRNSLKRFLNITCCFAISDICRSITEIHKYYDELSVESEPSFYTGKDRVFRKIFASSNFEDFLTLSLENEKALIASINENNIELANRTLTSICNSIIEGKYSKKAVQRVAMEIINTVHRCCKENEIDITEINHIDQDPYDTIIKFDSIEPMFQWICDIFKKVIDLIYNGEKFDNYSELTQKAIRIIHVKYYQDIYLSQIAQDMDVNSDYLSRVFKEDIGIGISEYINIFRINKAKYKIINENKSVKDIAYETGFTNYNYFFKVFKKYAGATPKEFESSCKSFIQK